MHVSGSDAARVLEIVRSQGNPFDANRDGRVSDTEFRSLLSRASGKVDGTERDQGLAPPRSPSGVLTADFEVALLGDPSVTTAQYRFGRVAQRVDPSSVGDQASSEAFLRAMMPELEAGGVTVLDVRPDQLRLRNDRGGADWVRVVQRTDGAATGFQWQVVAEPGPDAARILP